MRKTLGFAVLLFMVLACGRLGQKTEETTDIREVKQAYSKSKDEARNKYDGKEITILGTVTYVSAVDSNIRIGSNDSDIPITIPDIECVFDESDPLFKNISDKQTIKVKGVLKFTESGIQMKPCKFIPL